MARLNKQNEKGNNNIKNGKVKAWIPGASVGYEDTRKILIAPWVSNNTNTFHERHQIHRLIFHNSNNPDNPKILTVPSEENYHPRGEVWCNLTSTIRDLYSLRDELKNEDDKRHIVLNELLRDMWGSTSYLMQGWVLDDPKTSPSNLVPLRIHKSLGVQMIESSNDFENYPTGTYTIGDLPYMLGNDKSLPEDISSDAEFEEMFICHPFIISKKKNPEGFAAYNTSRWLSNEVVPTDDQLIGLQEKGSFFKPNEVFGDPLTSEQYEFIAEEIIPNMTNDTINGDITEWNPEWSEALSGLEPFVYGDGESSRNVSSKVRESVFGKKRTTIKPKLVKEAEEKEKQEETKTKPKVSRIRPKPKTKATSLGADEDLDPETLLPRETQEETPEKAVGSIRDRIRRRQNK